MIAANWFLAGNYDKYLEGKEEALRVEDLQNAEFDRKLAQEEVWIRQGIKARRTRNEGRVRALKAMRQERAQRREVMGSAKMQVEEAARSGKIVFELEDVNYLVDQGPQGERKVWRAISPLRYSVATKLRWWGRMAAVKPRC